jgi:hypothetical protein
MQDDVCRIAEISKKKTKADFKHIFIIEYTKTTTVNNYKQGQSEHNHTD